MKSNKEALQELRPQLKDLKKAVDQASTEATTGKLADRLKPLSE